jgi:DNA polymerase-3 subunit alpha
MPIGARETATVIIGRNFRLDEEMVGRIRMLPGVTSAEFGSADTALAAAA